jgi:ATP-dependent exoDNAse (exonuclease V) beta subunit
MTSGERRVAQRLEDKLDADGIPLVKPISCGREGQAPKEGHAWGDMAILCPDYSTRDLCAQVLHHRQMPVEMRRSPGDFDPTSNTIKVMTMKVSKGLEFPVVALPGVGHMPAKGEDEQEAARVFYVAATRATQRLVIGVGGDGGFGMKFG